MECTQYAQITIIHPASIPLALNLLVLKVVVPRLTRSRAFTIVELIVVVAVIIILAGIISPIIASSKLSARQTITISAMRQLGQSRVIYLGDSDNYTNVDCPDLVTFNSLDKQICGQGFEKSYIGLANEIARRTKRLGQPIIAEVPYRSSFITRKLFTVSNNLNENYSPSSGWALNYDLPSTENIAFPEDGQLILILKYDTSVKSKMIRYHKSSHNKITLEAETLFE